VSRTFPRRRPVQMSIGRQFIPFTESSAPPRRETPNAEGTSISVSMSPEDAIKVGKSRVIRNGFDPNTAGLSETGSTFANRVASEKHLFGIPDSADHQQRPVYAWLRNSDSPERHFGDAVLDVSPGDRRVTTVEGDSLMRHARNKVELHYDHGMVADDRLDEHAANGIKVEDLNHSHQPIASDMISRALNSRSPEYREVQVHGGAIPSSHITKATLYRGSASDVDVDNAKDALRSSGVPTRVMSFMEYQPTLDQQTFGSGRSDWVDEDAYRGRTKP
jgi:hypothetical protein